MEKHTRQKYAGAESVLVVDGEESLAKMIGKTLRRLGYHVTIVTNSVEALEIFRKSPAAFNLIITDLAMVHMTGNRLAEELGKIRADIPVILCSGTGSLPVQEQAAATVRKMVKKPFMDDELESSVRQVLDAAKASKQKP